MKEKFMGVGLGVGAALTLGIVWTDSAQAFSLNSNVSVENVLREAGTLNEIPYTGDVIFDRGPTNVVVGSGRELTQFGGLWDIDLDEASIRFTLTDQVQFNNVTSGDDVYSFLAPGFGNPGQNFLADYTFVPLGSSAFIEKPAIKILAGNQLEVTFLQGFALDLALLPQRSLDFRIDLTIQEPTPVPTPIPTPALLPGLVGMGLAVLRKRREDKNQTD
ncbi:PTPA-CTERM sorting domain-containing protein [Nodosilinea sp. LEGE 07298]|uniref:PTPA-CTERM sorting domain-containing protein n=1 Tax=Nodosilinea sp. LEGE 07298 TaxID=2777970 RepID=UPI00187E1D8E|nr:PTPA-CTERM sorting domain-containing protein [Nodosilinea sp. LEGE 07298]MBE9110642.1 PTPA-CTERM sorting domain-containing protein [Nodosilinea sp. LEGE 07298]